MPLRAALSEEFKCDSWIPTSDFLYRYTDYYLTNNFTYLEQVKDRTYIGAAPCSTRAFRIPEVLSSELDWPITHAPAPLDDISLINGCLKFDHPRATTDSGTYFRAYNTLDYWYGSIFLSGGSSLIPVSEAVTHLIGNTSSGWPWRCRYGVSKQEVLDKVTPEELLLHYNQYSVVYCASEKDELRLIGKDARLYRPGPVDQILEAQILFHNQLERFCQLSAFPNHPSAVGQSTPGPALTTFWQDVKKWPFRYSIDGGSHDAHFISWIADVIAHWTADHSDEPERVLKYFSKTYAGYTLVGGMIYPLSGMPSGQLRTTMDNSFHSTVLVVEVMYQLGFSLKEYMFKVEGDDIFLCTSRPIDTVKASAVLLQWDYYWEFMPVETPYEQLMFKGTHPIGNKYTYRDDLLQGLFYWGGNSSYYAQKVASITQDLYYSPYYEKLVNYLEKVFLFFSIPLGEQDILRRTCSKMFLEVLYSGFEFQSRQLNTPREKFFPQMQARKKLKIVRPAQRKAIEAAIERKVVNRLRSKTPRPSRPPKRNFQRTLMSSSAAPINYARTVKKPQPTFSSTDHGIRVRHSEYVNSFEQVTGADGLGFTVFPQTTDPGFTDVNPGFSAFCPWTSNIARCFERYRVHGLRFRLVPKQGTSSSGFIMASYCYDFDDTAPTTKQSLMTMYTASECSTFVPLVLPCDTTVIAQAAMAGGWRYISNYAASSSDENRETMAGYLIVAVDGLGPNTRYSWDMWIDYDFELSVPRSAATDVEGAYFSGYVHGGLAAPFQLSTVDDQGQYHVTSLPNAEFAGTTTLVGNKSGKMVGKTVCQPGPYHPDLTTKGVFSLGAKDFGVLTVNMGWNATSSNGGTGAPDTKGDTNIWHLNAYNRNTGDLVGVPNGYYKAYNEVATGINAKASIQTGTNYNSPTNTTTLGAQVSWYLDPTFWNTVAAAGLEVKDLVFGVSNAGSAVLSAALSLTQLGIQFESLYSSMHKTGLTSFVPKVYNEQVEEDFVRVKSETKPPKKY